MKKSEKQQSGRDYKVPDYDFLLNVTFEKLVKTRSNLPAQAKQTLKVHSATTQYQIQYHSARPDRADRPKNLLWPQADLPHR